MKFSQFGNLLALAKQSSVVVVNFWTMA